MGQVGTGDQRVEVNPILHLYLAMFVNNWSVFSLLLQIHPPSLVEVCSCDGVFVGFEKAVPDALLLSEPIEQGCEDVVVVVEDIGGVEGVVDVGAEHIRRYLVVPDESLEIVELSCVANVPLCDFISVNIVIVMVKKRTCFHHLPEGLILLGSSLVFDCHLPQQHSIATNTHMMFLLLVIAMTY